MTALRRPSGVGRSRLAAHLFVAAFLGVWGLYSLHVDAYVMPGPIEVAERFGTFISDINLVRHALYSFAHIGEAIVISFFLGTALALLPHYVPVFGLMVHGRLSPFLNSFSGIGWTLLAIVWFGVNDYTVVFAISAVLTPFAIINMREGLESLDAELVEMARSFGRRGLRTFVKIVIPSLYPFIFATLRISFGVSWKVALTAELFGGRSGLGYLFNLARQNFDTPLILVVIIVIIAFVYSVDRFVFAPVQAYLARHHAPAV